MLFIFGGFSFEDDFHGVGGDALGGFDLVFEGSDLGGEGATLALGSSSTEKTSPFKFFRLIFIKIL